MSKYINFGGVCINKDKIVEVHKIEGDSHRIFLQYGHEGGRGQQFNTATERDLAFDQLMEELEK